jgi:uncharacterized membrane protein (Fun14 family)
MTPTTPAHTNLNDYMTSEFLLGNVGAPFLIGLAVGYFAKKMLRTALFIGGGIIVGLFVAEYYGFTKVSDGHLQDAASTAGQMAKTFGDFLMERLSHITSKGVSAGAGFLLGLRWG